MRKKIKSILKFFSVQPIRDYVAEVVGILSDDAEKDIMENNLDLKAEEGRLEFITLLDREIQEKVPGTSLIPLSESAENASVFYLGIRVVIIELSQTKEYPAVFFNVCLTPNIASKITEAILAFTDFRIGQNFYQEPKKKDGTLSFGKEALEKYLKDIYLSEKIKNDNLMDDKKAPPGKLLN